MHRWTILIAAHALAATLALMLGLVVLRIPRKGNLVHRRLGKVWFAAMYFTALSSFGIKELHPGHFTWIHGLSLWTLFSLTTALWAARTGRRQQHQAWVIGSYCGLLGAAIAAMAIPVRLTPRLLADRPLVFAAVVVAMALVTWGIVRLARRPRRAGTRAGGAESLRRDPSGASRAVRTPARASGDVGVGGRLALRAGQPAGAAAVGAVGGAGLVVAVHDWSDEGGA